MNYLLFTDIHLKKEELTECKLVLEEILSLCNKHNVKEVFCLGDTFDKINPEPECLDLFATFIKKLNRKFHLIVAASHESFDAENSVVNHYGILNDNIVLCKEYIDSNYMYCGHFVLNESNLNYGASKTKLEFKEYKYVFLGHQHSYQLIKPNICHLGACRYIDFGEVKDRAKVICLIENVKEAHEKIHFLKLSSPYPMLDIHLRKNNSISTSNDALNTKISSPECSGKEFQVQFKHILDNLSSFTKIRVIFEDFETYKNVLNDLFIYKNKFVLFREKKNFTITDNLILAKKENVSLRESLKNYLIRNNVSEEIKQILLEKINEQ